MQIPGASPQMTRGDAVARTTSGAAVASLVCGILSISFLPFVAAFPAVICGHIARSKVKKSGGTLTGRGMALAGLIMGYLGLVVGACAIIAAIVLPTSYQLELRAMKNAQSIAVACRMYSLDHENEFPKALEDLIPTYVTEPSIFVCPFDKSKEPIGYEYYGAGVNASEADATRPGGILLVSKALSGGRRRVVASFGSSAEITSKMPQLPPH